MTQSSGRKETTNDPRGTQSRHRTVRPPGDAGGRATRSRGRTPDQGWLAASPQRPLRVGADRAGAGRSAQAGGRAHPRARGRGGDRHGASRYHLSRRDAREPFRQTRGSRLGPLGAVGRTGVHIGPRVACLAHWNTSADAGRNTSADAGRPGGGAGGTRRLVSRHGSRRRGRRDRRLTAHERHSLPHG